MQTNEPDELMNLAWIFMLIFNSHMHDFQLMCMVGYSHFGFQTLSDFHCPIVLVKNMLLNHALLKKIVVVRKGIFCLKAILSDRLISLSSRFLFICIYKIWFHQKSFLTFTVFKLFPFSVCLYNSKWYLYGFIHGGNFSYLYFRNFT